MSTCDAIHCGSELAIWKVSNGNASIPKYQDFHVCNYHLSLDQKVQGIHEALVKGRFERQSGNTVHFDGWNLEKLVSTWTPENDAPCCNVCEKTERIWIEYDRKLKARAWCDLHLPRGDHQVDLQIRKWNDNVGVSTLENTWTELKEVGQSSQKKRKLEAPKD